MTKLHLEFPDRPAGADTDGRSGNRGRWQFRCDCGRFVKASTIHAVREGPGPPRDLYWTCTRCGPMEEEA
jgi:hypothetical protein